MSQLQNNGICIVIVNLHDTARDRDADRIMRKLRDSGVSIFDMEDSVSNRILVVYDSSIDEGRDAVMDIYSDNSVYCVQWVDIPPVPSNPIVWNPQKETLDSAD
jgi:hypothetical protein